MDNFLRLVEGSFLIYKNEFYKPVKLQEDGIILSAWTTDWKQSTKAGINLKYEFYYDGVKIIVTPVEVFFDKAANRYYW